MSRSFARYRSIGHRTVQGWLEPQTLDLLSTLSDAQRSAGVDGTVAEIGVHHGQLFIALQLLGGQATAVAIDIFDDQALNVEESGRGDRRLFETNVRRWGDWDRVVVEPSDSTTLTGHDVRALAGGPVRLFSVDGGHTEETVAADLRTAEQSLCPGGIVVVDDVFNHEWPGVAFGTFRYLDGPHLDGPAALAPFAIGFNKVYLTDAEHAGRYRQALRDAFGARWRIDHKSSVFAQHDVEVFSPAPLTPRRVLRRSDMARELYRSLRYRRPRPKGGTDG